MKITPEEHQELLNNTLETLKQVLIVKGVEYIRNDDPLHNFNVGSQITGESPAKTLDGMLLKHYISYRDLLNDLEEGRTIPLAMIEEKFNDILVYFLLQKNIFITAMTQPTEIISFQTTVPAPKVKMVVAVPLVDISTNPDLLSDDELLGIPTATVHTLEGFQVLINGVEGVSDLYIRFYDK